MSSIGEVPSADDRWLPGPEVDKRYGITPMSRWRWMHDPALGFPQPVKIRRRTFWRLSDLIAWERQMALRAARKTEAA
jgi:predicted DNA-binding transcriptional regulator AlpA